MRRKILYVVLLVAIVMNLILLIVDKENPPFAVITTIGVLYVLFVRKDDNSGKK